MHHYSYDSRPAFSAAMSKWPFLTALRWMFFGLFLWHHLPFWNYLRLVCYIILKPHYQKSTQVKNLIHEILFPIHKINH